MMIGLRFTLMEHVKVILVQEVGVRTLNFKTRFLLNKPIQTKLSNYVDNKLTLNHFNTVNLLNKKKLTQTSFYTFFQKNTIFFKKSFEVKKDAELHPEYFPCGGSV